MSSLRPPHPAHHAGSQNQQLFILHLLCAMWSVLSGRSLNFFVIRWLRLLFTTSSWSSYCSFIEFIHQKGLSLEFSLGQCWRDALLHSGPMESWERRGAEQFHEDTILAIRLHSQGNTYSSSWLPFQCSRTSVSLELDRPGHGPRWTIYVRFNVCYTVRAQ